MLKISSLAVMLFVCLEVARSETPLPSTLPAESSVERILDALDASGKRMQSLASDVTLAETDTELGNETKRLGKLALKRHENETTVRVTFTEYQSGKTISNKPADKQEYLLDGAFLTRRDYRSRKQTRTQIRRPDEKLDLLKLGQGPFPLPVGQPREDVLKEFDVLKIAAAAEDLPKTVHVRLVPKPQTKLARRFRTIDVWVGRDDCFPHRIETVDGNETQTITTTLSNLRLNDDVKADELRLEPIGDDWAQIDETMKD